jgi:subtilisin family serine protease
MRIYKNSIALCWVLLAGTTLSAQEFYSYTPAGKVWYVLDTAYVAAGGHPVLRHEDGTRMSFSDELAVGLRSIGDMTLLQSDAAEYGLELIRTDTYTPEIVFCAVTSRSPGNALELANRLAESGRYAFAEPVFVLFDIFHTNDPLFPAQWAIRNTGQWPGATPGADMRVQDAWAISAGDPAIRIAIVDNGVQLNHPDLAANMTPGYDATGAGGNGGPTFPNDAHGTACAGIAAAVADNSIGIAGMAHLCKIMPVRISRNQPGSASMTTTAWQADGINWAWQNGADVISCAWGGGSSSAVVNAAIQNATTQGRQGRGTSVLFSAGNGNSSAVSYPASNPLCIAVGATSPCDERKSTASCDGVDGWGSNFGNGLDLCAPGVFIPTTDLSGTAGYNASAGNFPNNNIDYYGFFDGTSAAVPHAAAVTALILSVHPNLTQQEARAILERSCDKVGGYNYFANSAQPNGTWSNELGHGRVNAYAAVQVASGQCASAAPYPPADSIFRQLIALHPRCCTETWDDFCQELYDETLFPTSAAPVPPAPPPLRYYPNPAQTALTVEITDRPERPVRVQILSLEGKVLQAFEPGCAGTQSCRFELPLYGLPPGMYLLRIAGTGEVGMFVRL